MFTPEELEFMPRELERMFSKLEWRIMLDVVRRLQEAGEITQTADWQIYRLTELGKSKTEIKKFIREICSMSEKELDKIYEDAIASGYARNKSIYEAMGREFVPYAENLVLQQMVQAVRAQTSEQIQNITRSMGFARVVNGKVQFTELAEFYQKTLDDAVLDISSGAFDYNTVLKKSIDTMVNSGLRTVDYASGHHNRVEVAARRAIMTGVSQLTGKINEQNAVELGTEYFEVTRHRGARPDHMPWQGKVFTWEELNTVCGYGQVTGLKGANCRHDFHPFIPGVDKRMYTDEELERLNEEELTPKTWNGREYTAYEATQKQRSMERTIRAQRERIDLLKEGGAEENAIMAAKSRWRKTMHDYADFSDTMELPQEKERFYTGKTAKDSREKEAGKSIVNVVPEHEGAKLLKNIDFNDEEVVKSVLEMYENEIVTDTMENAIVVTKNGDVFRCRGALNSVRPDIDLGDKIKGAVMTHNHPANSNNEYSFSDDDVQMFINYNLLKMRGIDERYIYELTRNSKDIDKNMTLEEVMQSDDAARHEKMIEIARKNGFGYRRWKHE